MVMKFRGGTDDQRPQKCKRANAHIPPSPDIFSMNDDEEDKYCVDDLEAITNEDVCVETVINEDARVKTVVNTQKCSNSKHGRPRKLKLDVSVPSNVYQQFAPGPSRLSNLPVEGNFVTIIYTYTAGTKTKEKSYVGQITAKIHDEYEVEFMRPYMNSKNVYVFPHIKDVDVIPLSQIRTIVNDPECNRDKYTFDFQ